MLFDNIISHLGLFGNISQACHTNDEADCSNETKKTQTTVKDDKEADLLEVNLLKDTWFGLFSYFWKDYSNVIP